MHHRYAVAVVVLAGIALPGCSLPRGPINIDPIIPAWLTGGEVNCECSPDLLPSEGGPVDPAAIQPPVSRFHPVPTRPVFEPAGAPVIAPAAERSLTAKR